MNNDSKSKASTQANVIQFPVKKRDTSETTPALSTAVPTAGKPYPAQTEATTSPTPARHKATLAGALIAIVLASAAVNHSAFDPASSVQSLDASSHSGASRAIASVEGNNWQRDAKWEMAMAESLASTHTRTIASARIGRAATLEEKLRWGTLDDVKYTFEKPDADSIRTITLQGGGSEPDYIPDRSEFLREYGSLLEKSFVSASLKAVEMSQDKVLEQYTIYDKEHAIGEVHFELDRHKRLLSLRVEPIQI